MKRKFTFSLSDVMEAYKNAKVEKNISLAQKLEVLFVTSDEEIIVDANSEVASYIITQKISLESIILSYIKSLYKNNSSIKCKLKKIVFQFMENIENEIDSTYLIEMIKDDKELFDYISSTTTIEELQKDLKKKKKNNILEKKQKNNQLIKGKPYIN